MRRPTNALRISLLVSIFISQLLPTSNPARGQDQASVKLSGTVYFDGKAMPDFPVSLYSGDAVLQTQTDKSGRFEFGDLKPGTYDLQASYWGTPALVEGLIHGIRVEGKDIGPLSVDTNIVEVFYPYSPDCGRAFWVEYKPDAKEGGRVMGSLVLTPDVQAPSREFTNVRISLTSIDGPRFRASLRGSENGDFEFRNMRPGRYWLLARRRGYWKVRYPVWVMRKESTVTKIVLFKHGHEPICE